MTNYSRGAHFERVCKKYLKGAGWFVVRAAQSRGLADLMGARKTEWGYPEVCLVSCRIHGRWSPQEKQDLLAAAEKTSAIAFLASRGPGPHYLLNLDRLEVSKQ